jgi:hypothetical protein
VANAAKRIATAKIVTARIAKPKKIARRQNKKGGKIKWQAIDISAE